MVGSSNVSRKFSGVVGVSRVVIPSSWFSGMEGGGGFGDCHVRRNDLTSSGWCQ
jgi:hypothetical protein